MTDRERLIELLDKTFDEQFGQRMILTAEHTADYLLQNGVIVLPCKIGTKVWFIKKDRVPNDDYRMSFHIEWVMGVTFFRFSMIGDFGKTVFLTREEAEKALSERSVNNG